MLARFFFASGPFWAIIQLVGLPQLYHHGVNFGYPPHPLKQSSCDRLQRPFTSLYHKRGNIFLAWNTGCGENPSSMLISWTRSNFGALWISHESEFDSAQPRLVGAFKHSLLSPIFGIVGHWLVL